MVVGCGNKVEPQLLQHVCIAGCQTEVEGLGGRLGVRGDCDAEADTGADQGSSKGNSSSGSDSDSCGTVGVAGLQLLC